jgi:uncharacterized protein
MNPSRQSSATSSNSSQRVLVIMAKAPRPGVVKTRLAASLSVEHTTEFYRCLLHDTLELARSLSDVKIAVMCPQCDHQDLQEFVGERAPIVAQQGEGLAAGLTSVFAHFAADEETQVIAFNSDSPHLPRSVLERAFQMLDVHDVVVGPTHDGGYYLVGARASHPTLFAADGLGTSTALERLLLRAENLELSVGLVDEFYDVDVADDLMRLAVELREAPERAPRTAKWLRESQFGARARTGM